MTQPERKRQPGYYPGFSTLGQQQHWDEATRKSVLGRMTRSLELHFFTPQEVPIITAVFEHVLPQGDRDPAYRIPIVPAVDERLHTGRIDGYRYEGMPPDREAYRLGIAAIDEMARTIHDVSFVELSPLQRDQLLKTLHDGKPAAAHAIWQRMPVHRFWMLLVQDAAEAYYAHPYAWDEIGFGGPAYPRAYMRLERGEAEPWEVNEQRYEWEAPADSISDTNELIGGHDGHTGTPGQGGTH